MKRLLTNQEAKNLSNLGWVLIIIGALVVTLENLSSSSSPPSEAGFSLWMCGLLLNFFAGIDIIRAVFNWLTHK